MFRGILISILITMLLVGLSMVGIGGGVPAGIPVLAPSAAEPTAESMVEIQPTAESMVEIQPTASVDSVPVDSASNPVVLLPNASNFEKGLYNVNEGMYTGDVNAPVLTNIPTDVDIRLNRLLTPSLETIVWDKNDMGGFVRDGISYVKVYRIKTSEEIEAMSFSDRQNYVAYVDQSKIMPLPSTNGQTETEKLLISKIVPEMKDNFNSFAFMGKLSNINYQVAITGMVISDPNAQEHTIVINGHTVYYVDFLVYVPGKGLVKQGLAYGSDRDMSSSGKVQPTMFRGTAKYTHTSKTDNFIGVVTIPTKFIFETEDPTNYNIRYDIGKWNQDVDVNGMPLLSFYGKGYGGLDQGKESMRYLPFLPSNYYENFLKSGGTDFVVFFPGSDIVFGIVVDNASFSDDEINTIRSEWNENGENIK